MVRIAPTSAVVTVLAEILGGANATLDQGPMNRPGQKMIVRSARVQKGRRGRIWPQQMVLLTTTLNVLWRGCAIALLGNANALMDTKGLLANVVNAPITVVAEEGA